MNKSEQLIACLEVEIAKRDARIMGLESRYQRDVFGLNNECDQIGGDPAGGYANDNARLRAELAAIKAQGVVMPPSPYMPGSQPTDFTDYELGEIHGQIAMWEEVKRLNAAPAAPAADAGHVFYGMDGNHP